MAAQEALQQRVAGFQDGSAPPMHRARLTLPARVAMLLAHEPQLVAPAVDAFYNRDLAAMKASVTLPLRVLSEDHRLSAPNATVPNLEQLAAQHILTCAWS
jgi:SGT1 protein